MRVLFVSHSSQLYGSERSLLTLVRALRQTGRVTPVVFMPQDGPLRKRLTETRIETAVFPYTRWIHRRNPIAPLYHSLRNTWGLALLDRQWARLKPDLVYSNSLTNPFGALMARRHGLPHIWHAREFIQEDLNSRFDWGTRLSLRFIRTSTAKVICNSRSVYEKWSAWIPPELLTVIYNGFDFSEFAPKPDPATSQNGKQTHLILMASIQRGKGQEDAIRALDILNSREWNGDLELAGSEEDARYAAGLKKLARDRGVAAKVHWRGFVSDYLSALQRADIALVCSRHEAFGRVAVEAMGLGIPVIAADSAGLREIIVDGRTGLLYPPGDPQALADCIRRIAQNGALRRDLVDNARREVVSRFNCNKYVSAVQNTIDAVLQNS